MTKYTEVKRKAAVGERIKIVDAKVTSGMYQNGDEFTVKESVAGGVHPSGVSVGIWHEEYVVLEPVTSEPPAQLAFPEALALFVRENSSAIRKYLDQIEQPQPTEASTVPKPLTRAEVIEMARKDVAKLKRIGRADDIYLEGSERFFGCWFEVDFVVNREKRVVTALVYEIDGFNRTFKRIRRKPNAIGIAKCAPGDVFHAEIGKAIAMRKALGLTIPSEYTNAPQPDPATGAIVKVNYADYTRTLTERRPEHDGGRNGGFAFSTEEGGWIADKQYKVIDDTDVDYNVSSAKEAA